MGIEGSYIVNECDVGIREPGYLVMSMHTINLFEDKDDLNSLMTSINWVNVNYFYNELVGFPSLTLPEY